MSKYIKLFDTTPEYEAYINGDEVILPNVSMAKDAPTVMYFNPMPPMNIVIYESSAKLAETIIDSYSGIHTDRFNGTSGQLTITSHTFENGVGTIEFDGDVTSIGYRAFYNCTGLTSINIPDSVTSIGSSVFYNCSGLTNVIIGNSVISIDDGAFAGCSGLTSITIPNSVTTIGERVFQHCSGLISITIGSGVTSIGKNAVSYCSSLTSITSLATTAPTIQSNTFIAIKDNGKLYVPIGSTGYNVWMGTSNFYLGLYDWKKVEQ